MQGFFNAYSNSGFHQYAATDTYLPPPFEPGETKILYAKRVYGLMKEELGIEEDGPAGIDLVVDTSGAETCIHMGVLIAKKGGMLVQVCVIIEKMHSC